MLKQKLLLLGPSGAGKTTIMMKLHDEFDLPYLDIREPVIEILKERAGHSTTLSDEELKEVYEDLIKSIPTKELKILEIANDWPELFLDKIIKTFKPTRIVYVQTPLETCLARSLTTKFTPPEYRLKNQHKYNFEYYKQKAEEHKIPILLVKGTEGFLGEYQKVKDFFKSGKHQLH